MLSWATLPVEQGTIAFHARLRTSLQLERPSSNQVSQLRVHAAGARNARLREAFLLPKQHVGKTSVSDSTSTLER
jgi:hypothetical protein